VRGNTVNLTDPSGEFVFLAALAAIAIVGAVGTILGGIGGFAVDIYNQLNNNGGNWDCLDVGQAAQRGLNNALFGGGIGLTVGVAGVGGYSLVMGKSKQIQTIIRVCFMLKPRSKIVWILNHPSISSLAASIAPTIEAGWTAATVVVAERAKNAWDSFSTSVGNWWNGVNLSQQTRTVWDYVTVRTQGINPGFPKEFILNVDGRTITVIESGSKHLVNEYLNPLKYGTLDSLRISGQGMITSLHSAVAEAVVRGLVYNEKMYVGSWEFVFSQGRTIGGDVLHHIVYRP